MYTISSGLGQASLSTLRIVVADHDFQDFSMMRSVFENNNSDLALTHFENGQILLDVLRAQARNLTLGKLPDLILLDIFRLPGKSSFEVLKEIKSNPGLRKIPVVVFSNMTNSNDVAKCYELGASCFVNKPTSRKDWTYTLSSLVAFWMNCVRL